jgi:STAM-binding protein
MIDFMYVLLCSYQLMLPEAIAIVLAPKERSSGTFSLSTFGLHTIRNCPLKGFHPHNEPGLYGIAQHVTWRKVPSYVIVDFR